MTSPDERFMRVFASLLAASLALAAPAHASPGRVASLNLCTDELLLIGSFLRRPPPELLVVRLADLRRAA